MLSVGFQMVEGQFFGGFIIALAHFHVFIADNQGRERRVSEHVADLSLLD